MTAGRATAFAVLPQPGTGTKSADAGNGLLWAIWAIGDRSVNGSIPWPAWVSIVWGFFLALNGWRAYARWPVHLSAPITDAEIERTKRR